MPDDTYWYELNEGTSIQDAVDPGMVEAVWVHAWNTDGNDEQWFWVRTYMSLPDWETWDDLIANLSDMYNLSLA